MICCGIDPSLAAWLAESDNIVPEEEPPLVPLVILAVASVALPLIALFGHA